MSKKNSILLCSIIIMLGVIVIGMLVNHGMRVNSKIPKLFRSEKRVQATKIYDEIMACDLENDYPDTPESVMDVFCAINFLMFGDMIIDNTIYETLVEKLRILYAEEIITATSKENQYLALLDSINILAESKMYVAQVDRQVSYYPPENLIMCVVPIKQYINNYGNMYWNYYLILENGCWKIQTWERTDENYRSLD